jgi:hypothetical protein
LCGEKWFGASEGWASALFAAGGRLGFLGQLLDYFSLLAVAVAAREQFHLEISFRSPEAEHGDDHKYDDADDIIELLGMGKAASGSGHVSLSLPGERNLQTASMILMGDGRSNGIVPGSLAGEMGSGEGKCVPGFAAVLIQPYRKGIDQ